MAPKESITDNFQETRKLGGLLALEIESGRRQVPASGKAQVFCLEGDLGAGKTTFTQGLLEGLGAEGPYTSPTFLIMKHYEVKIQNPKTKVQNIYHFDAYRVGEEDILSLGWEELVSDPENVIIVEWPERIEKILPERSVRIKFEWLDENRRKITFV